MLNIQKNKKLSELSTFGIGGPARLYVEAWSVKEMQSALHWANDAAVPFFVIGKGSNCLFDDRGFNGLVILNKISFLKTPEPGKFEVGSGYSFSLLGVKTARAGFSGLEFASGIPATVGGAIFMNAGANGKETCETLASVEYLTAEGEIQVLLRKDLHFAYRTSSFQTMSGVILSAFFQLEKSEGARKKQLDIIHYRQSTQPYNQMSAGCIFRNPGPNAAGALIDRAGLKGLSVGDAKVSERHANFIVNVDKASSEDVHNLIQMIQEKVYAETGIQLESEVRYVPYDPLSS
jgi:UDP-N-acetylmuramate dehydrogenase